MDQSKPTLRHAIRGGTRRRRGLSLSRHAPWTNQMTRHLTATRLLLPGHDPSRNIYKPVCLGSGVGSFHLCDPIRQVTLRT